MSDCRHRQGMKRYEFSRTDESVVVEVLGCEKHDECTIADADVMLCDMSAQATPKGCGHLGEKVREGEGTCCSGGPIVIYACAVYGECGLVPGPGVGQVCILCRRHTERERRVMVCEGCADRQQ